MEQYSAFKRAVSEVNKAFDNYEGVAVEEASDKKRQSEIEYQKSLNGIVEQIRYHYVEAKTRP